MEMCPSVSILNQSLHGMTWYLILVNDMAHKSYLINKNSGVQRQCADAEALYVAQMRCMKLTSCILFGKFLSLQTEIYVVYSPQISGRNCNFSLLLGVPKFQKPGSKCL